MFYALRKILGCAFTVFFSYLFYSARVPGGQRSFLAGVTFLSLLLAYFFGYRPFTEVAFLPESAFAKTPRKAKRKRERARVFFAIVLASNLLMAWFFLMGLFWGGDRVSLCRWGKAWLMGETYFAWSALGFLRRMWVHRGEALSRVEATSRAHGSPRG